MGLEQELAMLDAKTRLIPWASGKGLVLKSVLWVGVEYKLGKGNVVSFWHDCWCTLITLKTLFW